MNLIITRSVNYDRKYALANLDNIFGRYVYVVSDMLQNIHPMAFDDVCGVW